MLAWRPTLDARSIHRLYMDGFYMDKTNVTNAQFAEFVIVHHQYCSRYNLLNRAGKVEHGVWLLPLLA